MTNAADKAEFEIVGTVMQFYADRAGKVAMFKVRTRGVRDKIHDVKYFGNLPRLSTGDRVRVVGEPGSEKTGQQEIGKNGRTYDKWATMLVAVRVETLATAQGSIAGTTANDNAGGSGHPDDDDRIPF